MVNYHLARTNGQVTDVTCDWGVCCLVGAQGSHCYCRMLKHIMETHCVIWSTDMYWAVWVVTFLRVGLCGTIYHVLVLLETLPQWQYSNRRVFQITHRRPVIYLKWYLSGLFIYAVLARLINLVCVKSGSSYYYLGISTFQVKLLLYSTYLLY